LYDIYQAHMSQVADPLNLVRPEVPSELAALVAKMMAKDPARRFQTPGEVAEALKPLFKPGANPASGPSPEISRVGQAVPSPQPVSARCAPVQPATLGTAPTPAPRAPSKPSREGVAWESLIEFKQTETVKEPAPAVEASRRQRPPWMWPSIVAASMLGLITLGVIIYVATDNGRIKVIVHGPRPIVKIDGKTVRIEGLDEPITLRAGMHEMAVKWGDGEFRTRAFVVRRWDNEELRVEYEPKPGPDKPPVPPAVDSSSPPKSLTNSIGMTLKLIPAGEFDMGTSPEEMEKVLQVPDAVREHCNWEKPRHHVRITRPIYFGATEVTHGQFKRFVEAEGYRTEAERSGGGLGWNAAKSTFEGSPAYSWRNPGFEQTDEHPVLNVSWNDAVAFCDWLSRTEKVVYRLPAEAEWEYACRAGNTSLYGSGNDPESLVNVGNLWDKTLMTKYPYFLEHFGNKAPSYFKASDGYVYTAPVGQFQPNAFGLYDMLGNVGEWCTDSFDADYYNQSPVDDPPGPPTRERRVLRGGTWRIPPWGVRPASRGSAPPDWRNDATGFRVVRELPRKNGSVAAGAAGEAAGTGIKAPDRAPASPSAGVWTSLFNGKDLTGWESLENGSSWKVENGVLEGRGAGQGRPAVLLSRRQDFKNFRLRAKVRYPVDNSFGWIELRRTSTDGGINAYIVFHGVWPTSIAVAPTFGSVEKASDFHYGNIIPLQARPEPTSIEINRWYTIETSLNKNILTTSVDGKKLSDYTDGDESYKFGAIALACSGTSVVRFQEIMIEELPADGDPGKTTRSHALQSDDRLQPGSTWEGSLTFEDPGYAGQQHPYKFIVTER